MKSEWEIIHECDDYDTGKPTQWGRKIDHPKYGKYVWISLNSVGTYKVEVCRDLLEFQTLVECKSLSSAKRWVTINLL